MTTACARSEPAAVLISTRLRFARIRLTADCSKNAAPFPIAAAANPRLARNGSITKPRVRIAPPPSIAASRESAAGVSQLWSNPACLRASYSRLRRLTASASRAATRRRSCGARSHRISSRRIDAAKSSDARRMPCHSARAARRPCAAAVDWNDASKSSRISPGDAAVAPAPTRSASRTTAFTPAAANDAAHAQPVRPPPTITTSVSRSPRNLGYEGRRLRGKRSSQIGTCRDIGRALFYPARGLSKRTLRSQAASRCHETESPHSRSSARSPPRRARREPARPLLR